MGATTHGGLSGKPESILIKIKLDGDLTRGGWVEAQVTEWIGAGEAARRLGINGEDGRASLFDAGEVDALARRGRPRHPRAGEFVIESALTEITSDRTCYRGLDITVLAARYELEDAAWLLWTGALTGRERGSWRAAEAALRAGRAAQAALPPGTLPLERFGVIVAALAAADPLRLQLDPPAVIAAAQAIMAGLVDCLPAPGGDTGGDGDPGAGGLTGRLWAKLRPGPPDDALKGALRAALVLLADHELAASTFAARVAASVRADPYAVVATGLGAAGGALHGGASLGVEAMLAAAAGPGDVPRVVGSLLRRGERIPGCGHFVYRAGDPRAAFLLGERGGRGDVRGGSHCGLDRPRPGGVRAAHAAAPPRPLHRPAPRGQRESGRRAAAFSLRERSREQEPAMAVRRLNHAVLYVHDLASVVRFYTEALGFEIRTELAGRAAFLRAPGSANDHDLGLFALDGSGPIPGEAAPRVGLYHLAWEVGTLAELDEARRRLADRGALVGASDHRVSKSLYAKDPSGIEFEVMWRVPAEDWEAELSSGPMIAPLDLAEARARWGDRATGAAAGSVT